MKTLFLFLCLIYCSGIFPQMKAEIPGAINKTDSLNKSELSIWEAFSQRRSVRKYKSTPIPQEDILKIINAACMAPTSGNQQPWKFLVVTDKSKIIELKEACIEKVIERIKKNKRTLDAGVNEKITRTFDNYLSDPVYIIVLTDNKSKYPSYNHWDGPLAAGYLVLAARALGYGTVFITDSIPESVTKKVFNIPDTYTRVCITPVGIPEEWPATPDKKELHEFIIYDSF